MKTFRQLMVFYVTLSRRHVGAGVYLRMTMNGSSAYRMPLT